MSKMGPLYPHIPRFFSDKMGKITKMGKSPTGEKPGRAMVQQ